MMITEFRKVAPIKGNTITVVATMTDPVNVAAEGHPDDRGETRRVKITFEIFSGPMRYMGTSFTTEESHASLTARLVKDGFRPESKIGLDMAKGPDRSIVPE